MVSEDLSFETVDATSAGARWAMERYFAELEERLSDGFDSDEALGEAAADYNPPRGVFLLGIIDGATACCGALHHLDTGTAEIKRMWVSPQYRGLGLGGRLLAQLEDEARVVGASRVVLDTNGSLSEALALYRSRGYQPIERYNDNPYAQHWFSKRLVDHVPEAPATRAQRGREPLARDEPRS